MSTPEQDADPSAALEAALQLEQAQRERADLERYHPEEVTETEEERLRRVFRDPSSWERVA